MTKLDKWSKTGTIYMYDVNVSEAFKAGAKDMRTRIHELITLTESINSDNIKNDPRLASYLLLQLAETIKTYGDENEI